MSARRVTHARKPKLAEKLVSQLGTDIIRLGWPAGLLIGNEAALSERYGVSRWAMREAIALAEDVGLVETRRGRNGGLYVASPAKTAVATGLRNYLEFAGVTVEHVMGVRRILEDLVLTRAMERLTGEEVCRLRALKRACEDRPELREPRLAFDLLDGLVRAARNGALEVFVSALAQLTIVESYKKDALYTDILNRLIDLRLGQAEAVIASDRNEAYRFLDEHMRLSEQLLARSPGPEGPQTLRVRSDYLTFMTDHTRQKRADLLAQEIQADIMKRGWPVGWHLGSQSELLEHYRVSRPVFREAVRSLEQFGVVEMRRGRGSGLKVAQPSPDKVIASAKRYLVFAKVSEREAFEVQEVLEPAAAGLAAAHPQRMAWSEKLRRLTELEGRSDDVGAAVTLFNGALAEASGNPILIMFMRILSEMFPLPAPMRSSEAYDGEVLTRLRACHEAVADAVAVGDPAVARRSIIDARRIVLTPYSRRKLAV